MIVIEGRNYINGKMVASEGDNFDNLNPCTKESIGSFPITPLPEVQEAVFFANQAFANWKSVSRLHKGDLFWQLAELIKKNTDELADLISLETGKNRNESYAEVIESLHMVQHVAGTARDPIGRVVASELAEKEAQIVRKPKGVIAVISPWNFPCAIGSFWCSAPAIMEGNCVVHKPSELTPYIAQKVAGLYHEAGFPPGVYNLVHGDGSTGKYLAESEVETILFTGSAETGQLIRKHCADTWHKTCSCEMGSKSAMMIFEDGDMGLALDAAVASAFKLSGQRCVSSGRMLIERSIYDEFCDKFVERASAIVTGAPETGAMYGPLISEEQLNKVVDFSDQVRADTDCDIILDGNHDRSSQGWFHTPFVYKTEWADKPFLKQEVFGPHVALIPFDMIEDAVTIYNDTDYGLALGVVTDDYRKMRHIRDNCRTGMLYINGGSIGAESHLPFTGVKKSGCGYPSAEGTYKAVTEEISVTTNYEAGSVKWAQGMK